LTLTTNDVTGDHSIEIKAKISWYKLLENKIIFIDMFPFEGSLFSLIVENLTALSFLVKDGCGEIAFSENGETLNW
jgi:hypothetical protein